MKKGILAFAFAPFLFSFAIGAASAADGAISETDAFALRRLYNGDEMLGVKPVIGFSTYNNDQNNQSTRALYGVAAELNLASPLGIDFTRWFVGPQTGLIISHLGRTDGGFLGTTGDLEGGGANLALIPIDLKAGVALSTWVRTGIHGGANVIYRSIASSIQLDETDLNWRLVSNFGADIDFVISKQVSLSIRPDWTMSSEQNIFSTTAALGIALN
jgi:hypothetical protein